MPDIKIYPHGDNQGGVSTIAWSPGGKWIASAGMDGMVGVWTADSMRKVCTYTRHADKVTALAWSPDGKWIASAGIGGTGPGGGATTGHRQLRSRGDAHPEHTGGWSPEGRAMAPTRGDEMGHG